MLPDAFGPDAPALLALLEKRASGDPLDPPQGYAGAIVYCKIGDWANVKELPW